MNGRNRDIAALMMSDDGEYLMCYSYLSALDLLSFDWKEFAHTTG